MIASGLREPAGVAFRDGALYVSAVDRILRFDDIERRLADPPQPVVVTDRFPTRRPSRPQVHRLRPRRQAVRAGRRAVQHLRAGSRRATPRIFAHERRRQRPRGLRARHPQHGRLRLASADEGAVVHRQRPRHAGRRRAAGRAQPRAARRACTSAIRTATAARSPIREFGAQRPCSEFAPPAQKLGPHVAALGMRFYTGTQFPAAYRNQIFIAEHGSWNRSQQDRLPRHAGAARRDRHGGRRTSRSRKAGCRARAAWGRPADVLVAPDGSLLVSDDHAGAIYRISYRG